MKHAAFAGSMKNLAAAIGLSSPASAKAPNDLAALKPPAPTICAYDQILWRVESDANGSALVFTRLKPAEPTEAAEPTEPAEPAETTAPAEDPETEKTPETYIFETRKLYDPELWPGSCFPTEIRGVKDRPNEFAILFRSRTEHGDLFAFCHLRLGVANEAFPLRIFPIREDASYRFVSEHIVMQDLDQFYDLRDDEEDFRVYPLIDHYLRANPAVDGYLLPTQYVYELADDISVCQLCYEDENMAGMWAALFDFETKTPLSELFSYYSGKFIPFQDLKEFAKICGSEYAEIKKLTAKADRQARSIPEISYPDPETILDGMLEPTALSRRDVPLSRPDFYDDFVLLPGSSWRITLDSTKRFLVFKKGDQPPILEEVEYPKTYFSGLLQLSESVFYAVIRTREDSLMFPKDTLVRYELDRDRIVRTAKVMPGDENCLVEPGLIRAFDDYSSKFFDLNTGSFLEGDIRGPRHMVEPFVLEDPSGECIPAYLVSSLKGYVAYLCHARTGELLAPCYDGVAKRYVDYDTIREVCDLVEENYDKVEAKRNRLQEKHPYPVNAYTGPNDQPFDEIRDQLLENYHKLHS